MTRSQLLNIAGIAGIFLNVFIQPVYAAEHQRPERDDKGFGPPHEALLACKGLSENDVCSFAGRNDEMVSGVCSTPHLDNSTTLACKPEDMPEPGDREPPPNRED
jgi:hypothetical protein